MLVLSRKNGEKISLTTSDGEIVVVVLEAKNNKVKLGIVAPKSVKVARDDIKSR